MPEQPAKNIYTLHRFRKLNRNFWRALRDGVIYFSQPAALNDPFDCRIDLVKAYKLARHGAGRTVSDEELAQWTPIATALNGLVESCGVACFCVGDLRGPEERLMWAHYADNHFGVCLTYCFPENFIFDNLIGTSEVWYETGPLYTVLERIAENGVRIRHSDEQDLIRLLATTKQPEWKYEKEARFVAAGSGPVKIDRAYLRQVCFGLRTPHDQRKKLQQKIRQFGYEACSFAEMRHSENSLFGFETAEVP